MAKKVAKVGVKREPGYLYFLRGSDVWKTPMKRSGGPAAAGEAVLVAKADFKREEGYLYFLDGKGDVARAKRAFPQPPTPEELRENPTLQNLFQTRKDLPLKELFDGTLSLEEFVKRHGNELPLGIVDEDDEDDEDDDVPVTDEKQLREDAKELIYTLYPDLEVPKGTHDIRLIADEASRIFMEAVERGAIDHLTPRQLEELLAECFRREGYETCLTPATRDGGRDVIAVLPGSLPYLVVAEAKRMKLVEPALVHSLVAVRDRDNAHMGLIATTGRFSDQTKAEVFKKWRRWVELRDGEQFLEWIRRLRSKKR